MDGEWDVIDINAHSSLPSSLTAGRTIHTAERVRGGLGALSPVGAGKGDAHAAVETGHALCAQNRGDGWEERQVPRGARVGGEPGVRGRED